MVPIYKIFKIIAGLMVSGFILYFLLVYITSYVAIQESIKATKIVNNFKNAVEDVYIYGKPVVFSDFSKTPFKFYIDVESFSIVSRGGNIPKIALKRPLFFIYDDNVLINKGLLDTGWWRFFYVIATPEMRIYFNPLNSDAKTWEIIENITIGLSDSKGYDVKMIFGFCDGEKLRSQLCGNKKAEPCEKYEFLDVVETIKNGGGVDFERCVIKDGKHTRIVTIDYNCSSYDGLCITPPNQYGIGNVYTSNGIWIYKDPLDLIVFILAENDENRVDFFVMKNEMQRRDMLLWIEITENRYKDIMNMISRLISQKRLSPNADIVKCLPLIKNMIDNMEDMKRIIQDKYYLEIDGVYEYKNILNILHDIWRKVLVFGCDYEF